MNWAHIAQSFPGRTPNICRKRYERLTESRTEEEREGLETNDKAGPKNLNFYLDRVLSKASAIYPEITAVDVSDIKQNARKQLECPVWDCDQAFTYAFDLATHVDIKHCKPHEGTSRWGLDLDKVPIVAEGTPGEPEATQYQSLPPGSETPTPAAEDSSSALKPPLRLLQVLSSEANRVYGTLNAAPEAERRRGHPTFTCPHCETQPSFVNEAGLFEHVRTSHAKQTVSAETNYELSKKIVNSISRERAKASKSGDKNTASQANRISNTGIKDEEAAVLLTQESGDSLMGEVDIKDPDTLKYYEMLRAFMNNDEFKSTKFSRNLTPQQRRVVHILAHNMGIDHTSIGAGSQRQVLVSKRGMNSGDPKILPKSSPEEQHQSGKSKRLGSEPRDNVSNLPHERSRLLASLAATTVVLKSLKSPDTPIARDFTKEGRLNTDALLKSDDEKTDDGENAEGEDKDGLNLRYRQGVAERDSIMQRLAELDDDFELAEREKGERQGQDREQDRKFSQSELNILDLAFQDRSDKDRSRELDKLRAPPVHRPHLDGGFTKRSRYSGHSTERTGPSYYGPDGGYVEVNRSSGYSTERPRPRPHPVTPPPDSSYHAEVLRVPSIQTHTGRPIPHPGYFPERPRVSYYGPDGGYVEVHRSSEHRRRRELPHAGISNARNTEEGRYVCPILGCGERFGRESDVPRHVDAVHPEEREKCSLCDVYIRGRDTMEAHLKRAHGSNVEPENDAQDAGHTFDSHLDEGYDSGAVG